MKIRLKHKIILATTCLSVLACVPLFFFSSLHPYLIFTILVAVAAVGASACHYLMRDLDEGLDALETGLLNLKDGEFSTTLSYQKEDEFGALCQLYNQTSNTLRNEKQWLYQRELLLDKIMQTSPQVLFLVNNKDQVVFSNYAAKSFFQTSERLEGKMLEALLESLDENTASVIKDAKEGLFNFAGEDNESETWHLSMGQFALNNQPHRLFILKQMTRELSRQEVMVWKKVIRVISHELNNSLGPISSMLHSGKLLVSENDDNRLERVFDTIDDRIKHLNEFVQGYGKFAKLPEPRRQLVDVDAVVERLKEQWRFEYRLSQININADPMQLEQLLINLIKNAHESGSEEHEIAISVANEGVYSIVEVTDRGTGMPEKVISNALIPFYSTKTSGTGLGLALCREIADAHRGKIILRNRTGSGVSVKVFFPK